MHAVFSTAYLPSIEYVFQLLESGDVCIEQWEHFQKQTARNRCHILSANGIQTLVIPVQHEKQEKTIIKDIKISYRERWQRIHRQALRSAYNKSPYFEFFRDDFEKILFSNKTFLIDLNSELLCFILKLLRSQTKLSFTEKFELNYPGRDFRFLSDVKDSSIINNQSSITNKKYPQVFSCKHGFVPNLSIIDLLFNKGIQDL